MQKVIDAIAAAYAKLDPADKAYFAAQKQPLRDGLARRRYNQLRAQIRKRFAGVPVGYSESIFEPLGAEPRA